MEKLINIVGACYYKGTKSINVGDVVFLQVEPTNEHDKEAVMVVSKKYEKLGYVSNSVTTRVDGCSSAGNICDIIDDRHIARVILKKENIIIAKIDVKEVN